MKPQQLSLGVLEPEMHALPKANPVKAEIDRLNAAAQRVLAFLEQRSERGALNFELCRPDVGGLRAIGRVFELQRAGHQIQKEHVEGGTWRYRLLSKASS